MFILWRSIRIQNFMALRWLVQVLHPPQKFERPPFCNGCSCGIKNYCVGVTFNCMTFLLTFIKSSNWFRSWWGGGGTNTHNTSFMKENGIKNIKCGTAVGGLYMTVFESFTTVMVATKGFGKREILRMWILCGLLGCGVVRKAGIIPR
jgi:hypothetical protein